MTISPEASAKTLTQLVATEIRVQMARHDVRQSQLARDMGKTEQWLSVRLRGRQPIDLNDLYLIARSLDVSVHQLLPAPEIVAQAADPTAMARYLEATVRTTDRRQRPPDNRPTGRPTDSRPPKVPRTGYLARVGKPTRGLSGR